MSGLRFLLLTSLPIIVIFAVLFITLAIAGPGSDNSDGIRPPVELTSIQPPATFTPGPPT